MSVHRTPRDAGDILNSLEKRVGRLELRGRGFSVPPVTVTGGTIGSDTPPPAPSDPNVLWVDTDDGNKIYRWNGFSWVPTMDPAIDIDRNRAATELASWQDTAASGDGVVTTYRQSAAPGASGLAVGDLWVDSDTNGLWRWSGSAWGDLGSTSLGDMLAKPSLLSTVADGRVKTWWQFNPPTAEGFGDVWVNTSTSPATLYRWNNYDWIQVLDWSVLLQQEQLEQKISTWYEPTPPTSTAIGDLWYDTTDQMHPYRAESVGATTVVAGQWVSIRDATIADAQQTADEAVNNYVVEYAVNSSETVPPVAGSPSWSTATPTRTPGTFIWFRTTITRGDGSSATTSPALLTGNAGAPGANAATITLAATSQVLTVPAAGGATTPATSTVTGTAVNTTITAWDYSVDGAAFSASVPAGVSRTGNVVTVTGSTMTARTIAVRMGNGAGVSDTLTVARVADGTNGTNGTNGVGVSSTTVTYQVGSSGTTAPTGTWQSTPQATTPGQYLWTRTFTTYTDTNTATAYSVSAHGATGGTGAAGNGVTGTAVTYQVGSSGTTAPTGTWVASPPATGPGQFLWTRTVTSFSASSDVTSYSVAASGTNGTNGVDGYTVLLTNESQSIPAGVTAAFAGTFTTDAIAYKGTAQQTISITQANITGLPTGMTAAVTNSGTTSPRVTFTVTTALTTPSGQVTIPLVVAGVTFNQTFSYALSYTGAAGTNGTSAEVINLSGTTQVLSVPAAGGATTPATAVVSGSATNTTIGYVEYKVDGGAWVTSPPTGVSIAGNDVTVTGSTFAGKTLTVRMSKSNGSPVNDSFTVARVSDGTSGTNGTNGADAYTVLLTNEANVFAGSASAAVAGSTVSQVLAFKGATQMPATIGTITGQVTGLTTTIQNNGTNTAQFTVTVTTSLVQQSGELTVPVTVDGVAFTKKFSWSVSYAGAAGLVWKAWSGGATYNVNDAVTYNGSSYRRIVAGGAPAGTPQSAFETFTPTSSATGSVYSRGMRLRLGKGGTITHLRFWRDGASTTTTRNVRLYSGAGTLLASKATSEAGAPNGWFQVALDTPVAVNAGDEIVSVYDAPAAETIKYATTGFASDTPDIVYVQAQYVLGADVYPSTANPGIFYSTDIVFAPGATPDADTANWVPLAQAGSTGVSVTAITPYFAQVAAGSAAPAKPTAATPPAPWAATEPTYAVNTELYRTDKITFSNSTFAYTEVSKSSSYAAAVAAQATADGKNTVYRQTSQPWPNVPLSGSAGHGGDIGDLWFDTTPGPGTAWNVSQKALTSNVATLTTSDTHDIQVGWAVNVVGVDSTFDGAYTVTAVTAGTVSYAKTAANVVATAVTGDATVQGLGVGPPLNHAYIWDGAIWNDAQDQKVTETTSTLGDQVATVSNQGELILALQIAQTNTQLTAYAADGRISISDYEPVPADVEGKNEGSLWITRTRDRQNLCDNPSFEVNTTGWTSTAASIARNVPVSPDPLPADGAWTLLVTNDATGTPHRATWAGGSPGVPVLPGQQWVVSAYAELESGAGTGSYAEVQFYDGAGAPLGSPVAGPPLTLVSTAWTRLYVEATVPTGAAYMRGASFVNPNASALWRLDAVLVEATAKLGRYFDGGSDGGSWLGASENSASELDGGAVIRLFELADGAWAEKWWSKDTISSVYADVVVGAPGYVRPTGLPTGSLDGALVADHSVPVDKQYAAYVTCSETLAAGDIVNVWNSSGLFMCRKAKASAAGYEAHGFVLDAGAVGAGVKVYYSGYNELLSGLAPGSQFLSTVAGKVSSAPPTDVGTFVQRVGFAPNPTVLNFTTAPSVAIV